MGVRCERSNAVFLLHCRFCGGQLRQSGGGETRGPLREGEQQKELESIPEKDLVEFKIMED